MKNLDKSPENLDKTFTNIPVGNSVSLDWLRYSVEWPLNEIPQKSSIRNAMLRSAVMPTDAIKITGEVISNPKGYNNALKMTYGSVRWHSELPKQKIGIEFTGKDLAGLRQKGIEPLELVKYAISQGAHFSRLDIALDVFGQEANPLEIHKAWEAGEVETKAKTCGVVNTSKRDEQGLTSKGITVYVGSRNSTRFLRVYNKALELKLDGVKWTRIELELGGKRAHSMASVLTVLDLADYGRAAIRDFCQVPGVNWYQNALDGPLMDLPVVPREENQTLTWLLKIVVPCIRRVLAECELVGDFELYNALKAALKPYDNR